MNKEIVKERVLLCTPNEGVGGITKWTEYVIGYFNQNPTSLDVELFPMNNKRSFSVDISKFKSIVLSAQNYISFILKFWKRIRKNKPELVHISSSAGLGLIRDYLMVILCQKYNIKSCIHWHFGLIPALQKSNSWKWKLLRRICNMSSVTMVMNDSSFKSLTIAGIQNVVYVPNPLSQEIINKSGAPIYNRNFKKVIYVGHVVETKGIRELVEVCKEYEDLEIIIIGKDLMNLKHIVNPYPNIKLMGEMSHDKVLEYLKDGFFLFPSYSEGFPNVILEAMAFGMPIIATQVGAIPEMLDSESDLPCGICIPAKSTEAIRTAIDRLTSNPKEAIDMGIRAKERVTRIYSIDIVCDKLFKIWSNAIH